jgi:2'-5' RNA ligase
MAALVLIPAYTPPLPDDAHLTLVWPGDDPEPQVRGRLVALARMFAMQHGAFPVSVNGIGMFGTNHNEPVLLCQLTPQLAMMRSACQQYSQSEYKEFRPHVAVPSLAGILQRRTLLPRHLYFHRVEWWPSADGNTGAMSVWLEGR